MKWLQTGGEGFNKRGSLTACLSSADHLPLWVSQEKSVLLLRFCLGSKGRLEDPGLLEHQALLEHQVGMADRVERDRGEEAAGTSQAQGLSQVQDLTPDQNLRLSPARHITRLRGESGQSSPKG